MIKIQTDTIEGQTNYVCSKQMHKIRSVDVGGKKVEFDVVLILKEKPKSGQVITITLPEFTIYMKEK